MTKKRKIGEAAKGPRPADWWKEVHVVENDKNTGSNKSWICLYCNESRTSAVHRVRGHLLAERKNDVQACAKIPDKKRDELQVLARQLDDISSGRKRRVDASREVASYGIASNSYANVEDHTEFDSADVVEKSTMVSSSGIARYMHASSKGKKMGQQDIKRLFDPEKKAEVDGLVSRWFYHDHIAFNIARSDFWRAMVDGIANYGPGYVPPKYEELRTKHLEREKKKLQDLLHDVREGWAEFGVSLIFDGWTDKKGRHIEASIAYSRGKSYFLMSHDISETGKTSENLASIWKESILFVGASNVVQIVGDGENANRRAGAIIEAEYPHIFFCPCIAHCLNNLLKDIGKLPDVAELVQKGKALVTFVNGHTKIKAQFMKITEENHNGKSLLKYCETRFGYNFIMLERLHELRWVLKALFVDEKFRKSNAKLLRSTIGKACAEFVFDECFWDAVEHHVSVVEPIILMLRLVDGNAPCLGKVYGGLSKMVEHMKQVEKDASKMTELSSLCKSRYDDYHAPIQAAAYYLDPEYQGQKQWKDPEVSTHWGQVLNRMLKDADERSKIREQYAIYKAKGGRFGSVDAQADRFKIGSALWWEEYGGETPELQTLAVRILSQGASSSPVERLFSIFGHVASKKRVRLTPSRTSDLVFVSANLKLLKSHRIATREPYIGFAKKESIPEPQEWALNEEAEQSEEIAPELESNADDADDDGVGGRNEDEEMGAPLDDDETCWVDPDYIPSSVPGVPYRDSGTNPYMLH